MRYFFLIILVLSIFVPVQSAQAATGVVGAGYPASCTETAFFNALNDIQLDTTGTLTFNCGGPATIILSTYADITKDITILGGNQITLSGNYLTRLFYVIPGASLTLMDITLKNGYMTSNGGAIHNSGTLELHNVRINNSSTIASNGGGAISSFGPVTIYDSLFEYNSAGLGGALALVSEAADAVLVNTTVRNNGTNRLDGLGGGIFLFDGADLTLSNSLVSMNFSGKGGGIYNDSSTSTITLNQGSVISGNTVQYNPVLTENVGGGIYNAGTLMVFDSTLKENQASFSGGAIYNTGTANLLRSTVEGNRTTSSAGGIYDRGTLSLTNVTISGNTPHGVYLDGTAEAVNTTFASNGVSNIWLTNGSISLKNSALSHAVGGVNCTWVLPTLTSAGSNKSSVNSCGLTQPGDSNNTDLLLGPLQDNGGYTKTHLPLSGSPLIDAGTDAGAPLTDQRGLSRPSGLAFDIGAVEVHLELIQRSVFLPLILR